MNQPRAEATGFQERSVWLVGRVQKRFRRADLVWSIAAGMAAMAAIVAIGATLNDRRAHTTTLGVMAAVTVASAGYWQSRRRWTPLSTAGALETRVGGLDNLIVTAISLECAPERGSRAIRAEVERQASARAALISPEVVAPLSRAGMVALATSLGAALVLWSAYVGPAVHDSARLDAPALSGLGAVRVIVSPPPYLGRTPLTLENPALADVPAGSRVRVEAESTHPLVWLADPGGEIRAFDRADGDGRFTLEWVPEQSHVVAISTGDAADQALDSRLLAVNVVADQAPTVRIVSPGRDLAFTTPDQVVEIEVEAADAEQLQDLDLRFIRTSGSGEAFEFDEGRVPLTISRASATSWRARARWALAASSLEDGDSLVYRAVVRDSNPAGQPVASESFTIDVGKRLEFAGAGFAVPDEERRYAISQQMVIVKTERLQAARSKYGPEEWAAETRGLAIEQRMVRSEVVFLSGGEIEDEVEEAAHSHELQEGRLENAGRAEMLRAMNEMSRAEARLNAGDTRGALVFERLALQALQRAFDRRRYFLRTLPERSRIDLSRRLSGDRSEAHSSTRRPAEPDDDPLRRERELMRELSQASEAGDAVLPLVAARLASIDPQSPEWRRLAAVLAAASTPDERRAAAAEAMAALARRAQGRLAPSSGREVPDPDPIAGWFAEEIRRRSRDR